MLLESPSPVRPVETQRLLALDALRGFSMFWLLGGTQLVRAATKHAETGTFAWYLNQQFTHVEWAGFHFYDFIFPLFLFCIGVAVPMAVERRLAAGDSRGRVLRHALIRIGWMIFFGWWVNGHLLSWDPSKFALSYSVLMMLGFGYGMAVALVLYTTLRTQAGITAAVLLGYWAVQMGIPVPGQGAGEFVPGGIFSDWFYDQTIGRLDAPWKSQYGRGWPVTMWTTGTTAMLGVFAWQVLRRAATVRRAVSWLMLGGAILLLAGWLWSFHLPMVKNRWSSSYVLWCGGWSWLLLGVFHALLAGLNWRRWAGLFIVIGSNSIVAYLISTRFMAPFHSTAEILVGGTKLWLGETWHALLMIAVAYGLAWLLLLHLHRQRLFLKL
jgi:predicted acyltransferase